MPKPPPSTAGSYRTGGATTARSGRPASKLSTARLPPGGQQSTDALGKLLQTFSAAHSGLVNLPTASPSSAQPVYALAWREKAAFPVVAAEQGSVASSITTPRPGTAGSASAGWTLLPVQACCTVFDKAADAIRMAEALIEAGVINPATHEIGIVTARWAFPAKIMQAHASESQGAVSAAELPPPAAAGLAATSMATDVTRRRGTTPSSTSSKPSAAGSQRDLLKHARQASKSLVSEMPFSAVWMALAGSSSAPTVAQLCREEGLDSSVQCVVPAWMLDAGSATGSPDAMAVLRAADGAGFDGLRLRFPLELQHAAPVSDDSVRREGAESKASEYPDEAEGKVECEGSHAADDAAMATPKPDSKRGPKATAGSGPSTPGADRTPLQRSGFRPERLADDILSATTASSDKPAASIACALALQKSGPPLQGTLVLQPRDSLSVERLEVLQAPGAGPDLPVLAMVGASHIAQPCQLSAHAELHAGCVDVASQLGLADGTWTLWLPARVPAMAAQGSSAARPDVQWREHVLPLLAGAQGSEAGSKSKAGSPEGGAPSMSHALLGVLGSAGPGKSELAGWLPVTLLVESGKAIAPTAAQVKQARTELAGPTDAVKAPKGSTPKRPTAPSIAKKGATAEAGALASTSFNLQCAALRPVDIALAAWSVVLVAPASSA